MKEENSNEMAVSRNIGSSDVPAVRVRFYPKDTDETFDGIVIKETKYSYLVIPDDNLTGTARWNKGCCEIIR